MARQRKLSPERKAFINSLIEHYHPEDAADVQEMLKDLLGDTLQGMLEAEMDEKLGYSKYDYRNKETDDSRNGYSKKTVTSSLGEIDLDIPRDRKVMEEDIMTREEVFERLNKVFQDVFDDDTIEVHDETTADDIDEWDSFEHINLVVAVEDEFSFKIPMGKVVTMKNVGEMVDIILEKTGSGSV